jgi:hypothetical protein
MSDEKIHRADHRAGDEADRGGSAPPAHNYPYSYGGAVTIVMKDGKRFQTSWTRRGRSAPRD